MEPKKQFKEKIVFMGTSTFAVAALEALINNSYNVVAVFTKPDKKIGRDQKLYETPVKSFSKKNNITVFQPEKFDDEAVSQVKKLDPDLILIAAYGKIIPSTILDMPKFGCLNVHASLLPRFRGSSPIQNVLMAGEKETGVTIIHINKEVDAGDILAQDKVAIEDEDRLDTLSSKLATLGANLILKTLPRWFKKELKAVPQDHSKATLCQLIEREDGHILWEEEAESIYNKYRAFYPWPGIFSFWIRKESTTRIKFAKVSLQKKSPEMQHKVGEVFQIGDKIGVQALAGVIFLEEVQLEGKKTVAVEEFIKGYPDFIGATLN